jgi:hypothetical protein
MEMRMRCRRSPAELCEVADGVVERIEVTEL